MVLRKFLNATGGLLTALGTNSNDNNEAVQQLEAMGFPRERAIHALNATDGDVERAAELLLLGVNEGDYTSTTTNNNNNNNARNNTNNEGTHVAAHNEEQMRRAIEESLQVNQRRETDDLRRAEIASLQTNTTSNNNGGGKNGGVVKAKKKPSAPANAADVIDLTDDSNNNKQPAASKPIAAKTKKKDTTIKSAASVNAGKAAVSRFNNTSNNNNTTTSSPTTKLNKTHPNVKLPTKLQSKTKEEQILRTANRVKPHVMAVDTLLRVLLSVRSDPDNIKFRVIDRTNVNYVTYVRDAPGAEDLLLAMNYRRNNYATSGKNELRLERHLVDDALLYLGISALEQMRESEEYKLGKKLRGFHGEMRRIASKGGDDHGHLQNLSQSELELRLQYMTKCPKEPPEGRGARMSVCLGDEREKITGGLVSRRFDGDDTLQDVLHWLGGCYGPELLEKLRSREWCLCDLNRYPVSPLDVERHQGKTLQFLGLFPSGKLGVRLSEDSWREGDEIMDDIHGSARGLGAASRSMLH
jgi:hypothetical protein